MVGALPAVAMIVIVMILYTQKFLSGKLDYVLSNVRQETCSRQLNISLGLRPYSEAC